MMRLRTLGKLVLGCVVTALAAAPRLVFGAGFCVSPADKRPLVELEEGLVVFDSVSTKEHLVLRFVTRAVDWAVIVPVPNPPTAREISSSVFESMEEDAARTIDEGRRATSLTTSSIFARGDVNLRVIIADGGSSEAGLVQHVLAEAGFAVPSAMRPWLISYVARRFHFVIIRFHYPPPVESGLVLTKSVDIAFDSPLAIYPTTHGEGPGFRLGLTWLVSDQLWRPVARRVSAARSYLTVPWRQVWNGMAVPMFGTTPVRAGDVFSHLGLSSSILDEQRLSRFEQGYADEKSTRDDVSDVVFVPATPVDLDPETRLLRANLADRVLSP